MEIGNGAEAKVYLENGIVIKHRLIKKYRIPFLDNKLRKSRTKREAKVLDKISSLNMSPKVIFTDLKDMKIGMEYLDGKKIRDNLDLNLCAEIGTKIGMLHDLNIIHGDLTTSNMILTDSVKFIDFGLSFFSDKIEDKAVDLHLLQQALSSYHYEIYDDAFKLVLEGYKKSKNYLSVIDRLSIVEKRGRNKLKN